MDRVILWSPLLGRPPSYEVSAGQTWTGKFFLSIFDYCFENKVSPHDALSRVPGGSSLVASLATRRFQRSNLAGTDSVNLLAEYIASIFDLAGGTERAVFCCFGPRLVAKDAIARRFPTDLPTEIVEG